MAFRRSLLFACKSLLHEQNPAHSCRSAASEIAGLFETACASPRQHLKSYRDLHTAICLQEASTPTSPKVIISGLKSCYSAC